MKFERSRQRLSSGIFPGCFASLMGADPILCTPGVFFVSCVPLEEQPVNATYVSSNSSDPVRGMIMFFFI